MSKIMRGISALVASGGLAILLPGPAWAANGPQPASGTFLETSAIVDSGLNREYVRSRHAGIPVTLLEER